MERAAITIVGAGPVGLTLANLLGVAGIPTVLLERHPSTVDEPRAIVIDAESLRTVQSTGLIETVRDELLLGFDADYVNAAGEFLLSVPLQQTPYGYPLQSSFDQPTFERQLRAGLDRFAHVDVRFGHTLEGLERTPTHVVAHGRRADGSTFSVVSDYLIGCDGGRSTVRSKLGIRMSGRTEPQRWLVVDTIDPFLEGRLTCRFFCDPERPGMTLAKPHAKRRWEWMLMPGETDEELLDEFFARSLIAPYTESRKVTIERKHVYTFHSLVADRYRDGRVLLAGDAAHMMPPFAGQGMNGGIRDARHLGWLLPLVCRGLVRDAAFDTYEHERRAHVTAAIQLANRLGSFIQSTNPLLAGVRDLVFTLVGLSEASQHFFDRRFAGWLRAPRLADGSFVPSRARPHLSGKMLIQPMVQGADGRETLLDELLGPGFAVIGFDLDPRQALRPTTRGRWEKLGARLLRIGLDDRGDAFDHTGALARWLGKARTRLLAVRPDRFVIADFSELEAEAVTEEVARKLHLV